MFKTQTCSNNLSSFVNLLYSYRYLSQRNVHQSSFYIFLFIFIFLLSIVNGMQQHTLNFPFLYWLIPNNNKIKIRNFSYDKCLRLNLRGFWLQLMQFRYWIDFKMTFKLWLFFFVTRNFLLMDKFIINLKVHPTLWQ